VSLVNFYSGFYRSNFEFEGVTHTMGSTQLESVDARRAFPCWDEPAHKATFDITLVVDNDLTALSNTPSTCFTSRYTVLRWFWTLRFAFNSSFGAKLRYGTTNLWCKASRIFFVTETLAIDARQHEQTEYDTLTLPSTMHTLLSYTKC